MNTLRETAHSAIDALRERLPFVEGDDVTEKKLPSPTEKSLGGIAIGLANESDELNGNVLLLSEASAMEATHGRTLQARKEEQFKEGMESISSGPAQGQDALALADKIRLARAKFDRLLNEGEFDEKAYYRQVTKREDALQDLLIEQSGSMAVEQLDFIIDYSGGTYDDLVAARLGKTSNGRDAKGKAKSGEPDISAAKVPKAVGETSKPSKTHIEPPKAVSAKEGAKRTSGSVKADTKKPPKPAAGAVKGGVSHPAGVAGAAFGPRLEDYWGGAGKKEDIAVQLMNLDPALYVKYVAARNRFVIDQANARGADLPPLEQKAGWRDRLRSKLPERFKKGGQQAQPSEERFDVVYKDALEKVLAGSSSLSPDEIYKKRMEFEADAGYALEWDISKKKIEAGKENSSLSRKAALLGGMGIAAVAGAGTGVWERLQKGEHELKFLLTAGLAGAVAGFGAARAYRPLEDEGSIDTNAQVAEKAVRAEYQKSSGDTLKEKSVGPEAARGLTKRSKIRALGRTAIWAGAGALAGAGGHLLIDTAWPALSNLRLSQATPNIDQPTPDTSQPTPDTSQAANLPETYDALDTNRDHITQGPGDIPDANNNGINDIGDLPETYDPLDTNRDHIVQGPGDIPDANNNGINDIGDLPETYDPLDTNHDHIVQGPGDIPDVNNNGINDIGDVPPSENFAPGDTNHDGFTNSQDVQDINGDNVIDHQDQIINDTDTDTAQNQGNQEESTPSETLPPDQNIYIDAGSGITPEIDQYVNTTYGVDLTPQQLNTMYHDLFETGGYRPQQIFGDVEFYVMDDGRWGMIDVGHATLTGVGQGAIGDWLAANRLG